MRGDKRGDLDVVVGPPPGYHSSNGRPESDPHSTFGTHYRQHLDAFQSGVSGPGDDSSDFANGVERKIRLGGDEISRPEGRFWLLANRDDEEETIANDGEASLITSPTPSDGICNAFQDGLSEEEVAKIVDLLVPPMDPATHGLQNEDKVEIARRVVRRRTVASSLRQWHAPFPR
ncbi:hypothetical protein D1007_05633 [Hordeum vulgare]|nr:hypothetical protein D1007_05633 [Hordeum vulgare]